MNAAELKGLAGQKFEDQQIKDLAVKILDWIVALQTPGKEDADALHTFALALPARQAYILLRDIVTSERVVPAVKGSMEKKEKSNIGDFFSILYDADKATLLYDFIEAYVDSPEGKKVREEELEKASAEEI